MAHRLFASVGRIRRLRRYGALLVGLTLLSCRPLAPDFVFWHGYDIERVALAPVIVVARVQDVVVGRRVKVALDGRTNTNAREWQCQLEIERVLRGNGIASTEKLLGYALEQRFVIGGEQSVCSEPGSRSIYFLRRHADQLRPVADLYDSYAIHYRLHSSVTIPVIGEDFASTFWGAVWNSARASDDPARTLGQKFLTVTTVLGDLTTFRLLRSATAQLPDPRERAIWCIFLNRQFPGWGASGCLDELWAARNRGELKWTELVTEVEQVRTYTADQTEWLKRVLGSRRPDALNVLLGGYKVPRDPREDREFLLFLATHADSEIRRLAFAWSTQ